MKIHRIRLRITNSTKFNNIFLILYDLNGEFIEFDPQTPPAIQRIQQQNKIHEIHSKFN